MHPILIPWNILTTGWDSYVHTFTTTDTMTYLDLLTTIQSFSEEELQKQVLVWDEDLLCVSPVSRICRLKDDPENNIGGELSGDLNYYIHI